MKTCSFDNCTNKSISLGYCDKHYRRFKKYGSADKVHTFIPKVCSIDNCNNQSRSKGLCELHYRRLIKTGTTEYIKVIRSCLIIGCERKHVAKNLCGMHYEMKTQKISIDENAMKIINNHSGFCDICGTDSPGFGRKNFCIDHNHSTGSVRGMLCQKCNIGIGNFNDSPELLNKAIRYLTK